MRGLVVILLPALVFSLLPLVGNHVYAANTVTNVTVAAIRPWTDTGLTFPQGYTVVAKYIGGSIAISSARQPLSPFGIRSCVAGPTFVAPGLPCYSLIGRIDNGSPFPLGTETMVEISIPNGGRLYLGVNDETLLFDDNVGGWNFDLLYPAIPAPHPTPTPTPIAASSKNPLIFIPGVAGSEFKTSEEVNWSAPDGHGGTFEHTYPADETVWVNEGEAAKPGNDDYFDVLRLQSDGQTSEANVALMGEIYGGIYQETINFFLANGHTVDQDFFVFPYDWRKDIALTTSLLDEKIEQVKQQTGAEKVDIVTHSMGGLVARNYIADGERAQKVRKLITLGAPHLGSVELLKNLRYGGCLTRPELTNLPICFGLTPSEIKDVIQNMIGGYELAPSQTYFTFYSGEDDFHPFPFADMRDIDNNGVTGTLNYNQIKTFLTNLNHNTSLFIPSETFHNLDSNLGNTNGVDVTNIVGSGIPTLGQIVEKYSIDFLGIKIPHRDEIPINGDDTVPLFSASLTDPSKNVSMVGTANVFYTNQKHGALVSDGPALQLVKNMLDGITGLPDGVSKESYSFSGTRVSVHSPVNIHAYDANGNHTGPTPDGFESNIPGSSYDTLDDAKFIWLPNDGQYTIKLEASDQGTFDFKIKRFENDVNTSTILYNDIPLTNATKAQATLDTSSADTPALQLDNDGDATVDSIINPSLIVAGASSDETPPQTTIALSGIHGNDNWYKSDVTITLTAVDAVDGSGVDKIQYSLDNGQTLQTYTNPLTITQEGVTHIKFRAIDKAGNEETPQEITANIDKTAPEAKIFVDQNKQDLVVEGVDANQVTVTRAYVIYTVADEAGNVLRIDVREREKEKQDRFRLYSLQYNEDPPTVLENNHFTVTYQDKKNKLHIEEQNFEIKGEVKIRILYDAKKNQSTIILKEPKEEKVKEVKDGLSILKLLTNKGQMQAQY